MKKRKIQVAGYAMIDSNGNSWVDKTAVDEDVYGILNQLSYLHWWNFIKRYKLLKLLNICYRHLMTVMLMHYSGDRLIYHDNELDIKVNPLHKIITINNLRYTFALFEDMNTFQLYTPFTFVERKDGVVTLQKHTTVIGNN